MPPRRTVRASPTPSLGRAYGHEDANASSSYIRPRTNGLLAPGHTSVNEANAIMEHQQNRQNGAARAGPSNRQRTQGLSPQPHSPFQTMRALSPAAQVIRQGTGEPGVTSVMLHPPTERDEEYSGESSSSSPRNENDTLQHTSHSYLTEDGMVENNRRGSQQAQPRRRKGLAKNTDAATYRPDQDVDTNSDDSGVGGVGVVAGGALNQPRRARPKRQAYQGTRPNYNDNSGDENERPVNRPPAKSPAVSQRPPSVRPHMTYSVDNSFATEGNPLLPRRGLHAYSAAFFTFLRVWVVEPLTKMYRGLQRANTGVKIAFAAAVLATLFVPYHLMTGNHDPHLPPSFVSSPGSSPGPSAELSKEFSKDLAAIQKQVDGLSGSNKNLWKHQAADRKAASALENRIDNLEASVAGQQGTGDVIRGVQKQVGHVDTKLNKVALSMDEHDRQLANLNAKVDSLQRDHKALAQRVGVLERDIKVALDDGHIRSALEAYLPDYMPVLYENGKVVVHPSFWTELERALNGKLNLDSARRWDLDDHKDELAVWFGDQFRRHSASFKDVVTRAEFLDLVENEIPKMREEMRVAIENGAGRKESTVTFKTEDGDDVTSHMLAIAEGAILKYSKDGIARRDFAAFGSGARVSPAHSSPSMPLEEPPSKLTRWFTGAKAKDGNPPAMALTPSTDVGSCWPFEGSKGQLAVELSRVIIPDAITIEHAAKEVTIDYTSAPKDVEVWLVVEGEENLRKSAEYLALHASDAYPHSSTSSVTPDRLKLGKFTYDPELPTPIQTFALPADLVALGISGWHVVFKFESNYGAHYTCVYRVRVHGQEVGLTPREE